jgi:hypothetical protein
VHHGQQQATGLALMLIHAHCADQVPLVNPRRL